GTVSTTFFTDSSVNPGQTYTYTVEAVKGEFTSEKSNGATVTTGIANVTDVKAEAESSSDVVLTWTEVTGAKYYKIFDGEKIIDTVEDTSCTVSGLTGNTSYKFYVQAFVNESVSSAKVKSNTVKTKITPVDTSSITVSNRTADSVTLTWKKNVYNENYRIYIGNPSTHASFGYIQTNTLYNATIKNLEAGKTYTIYIETYIDSETSDLVPYTITTAAA
ncbi:MAG: fibronectin type III domain-containing protein, partial [Oscillospiraceae bacterium]|nr:fibronectin type III domain-containing protein [Oscillospiraceae bacterium]